MQKSKVKIKPGRIKREKTPGSSILPFIGKIMSAAEEKQAADIVKIRLKDGIADYFIILSCKNERQIKSVVNEIEKQIREQFSRKPFHIDGMPECEWVVMDYGDVIVHAFLNDLRDLYDLESLWGEKKDQIRKRRIRTAFDDEDEI